MNRNYQYRIEGVDHSGFQFDLRGEINCRYDEAFDKANREAIARIMVSDKFSCPIRISSVTIINIDQP